VDYPSELLAEEYKERGINVLALAVQTEMLEEALGYQANQ
jgi:hypothetical protein